MNTNSDHLTGTADQDVPAHSPAGALTDEQFIRLPAGKPWTPGKAEKPQPAPNKAMRPKRRALASQSKRRNHSL